MPQFRKKPVVIEAMQIPSIKDIDNRVVLDDWLLKNQGDRICRYVGKSIEIPTLEGVMVAEENDWIIKGVAGELYPCKPDIFEETYEPA